MEQCFLIPVSDRISNATRRDSLRTGTTPHNTLNAGSHRRNVLISQSLVNYASFAFFWADAAFLLVQGAVGGVVIAYIYGMKKVTG